MWIRQKVEKSQNVLEQKRKNGLGKILQKNDQHV